MGEGGEGRDGRGKVDEDMVGKIEEVVKWAEGEEGGGMVAEEGGEGEVWRRVEEAFEEDYEYGVNMSYHLLQGIESEEERKDLQEKVTKIRQ